MSDEKKSETFDDYVSMGRAAKLATTCAVTALSKEEHAAFFSQLKENGGRLEVAFAVNGIPLPFAAFMERLDEAWEKAVSDAAAKMIVGKATELQRKIDRLDAVMREVTNEVCAAVREEFPGADLTDRE